MEELDEQFFTAPPPYAKVIGARGAAPRPSPAGSKAVTDADRSRAQNLFAAKQSNPPVGRGFAISVGIGTLLATVAIGAYFYWQLQPKGGLSVSPALMASPSPATARRMPDSAAVTAPTGPMQTTPPTSALPSDGAAILPLTISSPSSAAPQSNATPGKRRASKMAEHPRQPDTALAATSLPDNPVRLSKQTARIDDSQETAYAAFNRGEYELARTLWLKALRNDARNLDALLGLAVLAQHEGKPDLAEKLYRQAIEVDPKNPVANAGLLAVSPPSDPRLAESRLKSLLVEQPDSPHLYFALGNLYLAESRWAEAQQAFFKAHVADPGNADYLYNLAVSLDHLHQDRLAAEYYARALAASRSGRPAAFDPAQAETRLQALQAAQGR
ncbi:tetratricopeptide repeat protein [Sulfuricystis multivorans]|uniref:tetratricopeptide repeat protein n=1 Tax=Sulfuricystis multivorans TaxID=2211108 RepID=UPI001559ECA1|nr:tetratricopeptide repeat protein [Sulfuricystis multivorans]